MDNKQSQTEYRKWFLTFFVTAAILILVFAGATIILDPYFHYHKPLPGFGYLMELSKERYINDGIVKNYEYDAMITGSSMTECFSTTVCDETFGTTSVKVPLSGGSYKEVDRQVQAALNANDNIRIVIRGLDGIRYFNDKDACDYDENSLPHYLYDNNPFNDAEYVLNKRIFVTDVWDVVGMTRMHKPSTTFDEYANWDPYYLFGKEGVSSYYGRDSVIPAETQGVITDEEYEIIRENVAYNIEQAIKDNPDVEFYYFFTPYSIYYWDYMQRLGELDRQVEAERYIASLLVGYDNLHLYSFYGQYDFVSNLDNYKDTHHYGGVGSNQIIEWLNEGVGEITAENLDSYYDQIWEYYTNYDYDALFE